MSKKKNNAKKKGTANKKSSFPKGPLIAGILVACLAIGLGVYALFPKKEAPTADTTWEEAGMKPHLEGAQSFLEETPGPTDTPTATPGPEEAEGDDDPEGSEGKNESWGAEGDGSQSDNSGGNYVSYLPGPDFYSNSASASEGNNYEYYVTPEPIPTISFPYAIGGTNLVVQQISPYSGYFLEDGSDRGVDNIAAIVLTNNGEALDFAGIGIAQGENSYAFSGSQIPAHSTVIIQEQSGAVLAAGDYHSCTATTTPSSGTQTASDRVQITDNGNNTFEVANLTDATIPEVTVYFKNYLPDEDVYVGGITYHITVNDIAPGTAVDVNSGHYASGYSVIVDIDVAG